MTDDKWCAENDAAYRAELAEAHRHKLASSPDVAALIREAEARGMERAMPSDQAIQDLADHIWRVHPNEIAEAGYAHVSHGGKYENPRAAWYADQIKALCRAAAIRAAKGEPT